MLELGEGEKQSFSKSLGVVLSNWRAANTPRTIPQRMEPAENTADMIKMVFSLMAPPLWEMKRQLIFPKEAQKKEILIFLISLDLSRKNHIVETTTRCFLTSSNLTLGERLL